MRCRGVDKEFVYATLIELIFSDEYFYKTIFDSKFQLSFDGFLSTLLTLIVNVP